MTTAHSTSDFWRSRNFSPDFDIYIPPFVLPPEVPEPELHEAKKTPRVELSMLEATRPLTFFRILDGIDTCDMGSLCATSRRHAESARCYGAARLYRFNDYARLPPGNPLRLLHFMTHREQEPQWCTGGEGWAVIAREGRAFGIGANHRGQLGVGDAPAVSMWQEVPFTPRVKTVAAGRSFLCVLTEQNTAYTCGENISGQLARDTPYSYCSSLIPAQNHVLAMNAHESLLVLQQAEGLFLFGFCPWKNILSTPLTIPSGGDVLAIEVGADFLIVLDRLGTAWSCGKNGFGQLGINSRATQSTFRRIDLNFVRQISVYGRQACCVLDTRVAYMWGSSIGLGLGDSTSSKIQPTLVDLRAVMSVIVGPKWVAYQTRDAMWIQGDFRQSECVELRLLQVPKRGTFRRVRRANDCILIEYDDDIVYCEGDGLLPVTFLRSWAINK
eukprot:GEMP01045550.1.p1 GENE.GEMP01045550.1~~GEMP01045550.1.p1  ORF type:complete len:453 (+),score=93.00 GEMP01045550.1:36-1361(+)